MAKLMLVGAMAQVEIEQDEEAENWVARCVEHSASDGRLAPAGACSWQEHYDDLNDATEYAAPHADNGDPR